MPKKQVTATESAAAAAPARAAKPKSAAPRVRTAKHSKTVSSVESAVIHMDAVHVDTPQSRLDSAPDPHEAIARIAYGYWESRGYQHGMHIEDWLRAEKDYQNQIEPALA